MAMTQPTAGDSVARGQRKTKVGRVVSDKMDKTIVVSVERLTRHRLYKRVVRLTTKFKAHDEANEAHVGDAVLIEESRPLSATKRWRLIEVVQRAGDHGGADLVTEEAAVSEAIHAAAHPGRGRQDADDRNDSEDQTGAADAAGAAGEDATAGDASAAADKDASA